MVGVLLAAFGLLAGLGHLDATRALDEAVLRIVRDLTGSAFDQASIRVSLAGHERGVVPFDVLLVLGLLATRRVREGLFAAAALGGSGLLNVAMKHAFARERPALWESIAPEHNFSFPSGHAMGSMTLATVLVLLAWPTRWRWPVLAVMAPFVGAVGLSRVHLGVHYPSDVLGGWLLAVAWALAVYAVAFGGGARPRVRAATPPSGSA